MKSSSPQVVAIELCSGILPATLALKKSGLSSKTFFSEIASDPVEVTSAHWPEAIPIGDMRSLDSLWFNKVVAEHPDSVFWLTAGVPCKDVSSLNTNRSGALGKHSKLHEVVAKIIKHLMSLSDNVVFIVECTRMDDEDRAIFSAALGCEPIEINNKGWSPLSRPRWWWIGGKIPAWPKDTDFGRNPKGIRLLRPKSPASTWDECILKGYKPCTIVEGTGRLFFNCLTTRAPKGSQPKDAVGLNTASAMALQK